MEILIFLIIIILFNLYAEKNAYHASIMLDAPTIALCSKLCRHNVSNPILRESHIRGKFNMKINRSMKTP